MAQVEEHLLICEQCRQRLIHFDKTWRHGPFIVKRRQAGSVRKDRRKLNASQQYVLFLHSNSAQKQSLSQRAVFSHNTLNFIFVLLFSFLFNSFQASPECSFVQTESPHLLF